MFSLKNLWRLVQSIGLNFAHIHILGIKCQLNVTKHIFTSEVIGWALVWGEQVTGALGLASLVMCALQKVHDIS